MAMELGGQRDGAMDRTELRVVSWVEDACPSAVRPLRGDADERLKGRIGRRAGMQAGVLRRGRPHHEHLAVVLFPILGINLLVWRLDP